MTSMIVAYIIKSLWWIIPSVAVLVVVGIVERIDADQTR